MGRLGILLIVVWIVACAFVFGGAAPLGFVVFGLVPPAVIVVIRLALRLRSRRLIYYGPF